MTCSTCKQPIRDGELKATNGQWHVRAGDCVRAVAQRCAAIATEVSDSYDFPSDHAVGAETVAVTIRKEFSL